MALFPEHPDVPYPSLRNPSIVFASDNVIAGPYDSGREVMLNKRATQLADINFTVARACWNELRILAAFHQKMRGRFRDFSFLVPFGAGWLPQNEYSLGWEGLYVGVTNGVTATYDLPMRDFSEEDADHFSLYGDDVLIAPTAYSLSDNALATPTDLTTWTPYGTGAPAFTSGQADPATPPGTAATLVEYVDMTVPKGIFKGGNAVLSGDTVLVDVWLKKATAGTLPITVWAQTDVGDSVAKVVTLTEEWQNVTARVTATANGNKVMQIGFTGDQTVGNFLAYNARIRPGRDSRAQVTFSPVMAAGVLLTVSPRSTPVLWARFGSDSFQRTPGVFYQTDVALQIKEVRV